jgi:hypothetical protein
MPLLNDNDLDRLSREAADQYDVDQSTSGWEALEQRLDQELPQDRRRRRLLFWWLLAGVLLLGGALWGLKPWRGQEEKNGIAKKDKAEQLITESNNRNDKEETTNNTEDNHIKEGTVPKDQENTATGNDITEPIHERSSAKEAASASGAPGFRSPGGKYSAGHPNATTLHKRSRQQNSTKSPSNPSISATLHPTRPSDSPYKSTEQDLPERNETVTSSNPVQTRSIQNTPDVPGIKPTPQTSITDSNQHPATVQPTQTTTNKSKPLNLSFRKGSFYITPIAGLDFSNVEFSSTGRTGFNGGVQIGYYFTERLSINTGLIYNKKNYKARGKDFTPKGPMVYYDIDKIEGGCAMFDIPLNIRYDLNIKPRSRYFISAGISSYLMDKEDYDYYYYNNAGNYAERNWKTSDNSNYLFSILNFSAGMEKQLGKKNSFMAEPYLKVPVQGVGNGEIRLNSFGINLGLKYQFGKKGK